MGSKVHPACEVALADLLSDGMTIMCGGSRQAGVPRQLLQALREFGPKKLTLIVGDLDLDPELEAMIEAGMVQRVIASSSEAAGRSQFLENRPDLAVGFETPKALEERIRAAGAGIPAFYTVEPPLEDGGITPKIVVDGVSGFRRTSLRAELALVKAWRSDSEGNLSFHVYERNYNPVMATAAQVTVVEADVLMGDESMDGDHIHTPGIFVDRIVAQAREDAPATIEARDVGGSA